MPLLTVSKQKSALSVLQYDPSDERYTKLCKASSLSQRAENTGLRIGQQKCFWECYLKEDNETIWEIIFPSDMKVVSAYQYYKIQLGHST